MASSDGIEYATARVPRTGGDEEAQKALESSGVEKIEEILGVPQPSVSQHLARLKYAGVIESERRGHLVCYRLKNAGAVHAVDAVVDET